MHIVNAHTTSVASVPQAPRVSSFFFWLSLLTTVVLMLDPLNPGVVTEFGTNLRLPRDIGPGKYVGIAIGWIALVLGLAGLKLNQPRGWQQTKEAFARSWPITMFFLMMLGGSLIARFGFGIVETFLAAPLAMTAYAVGLVYIFETRDPVKLVQRYFLLLLCVSPYMVFFIFDRWINGGQAFHEDIFVLIPLAVYYRLINGNTWRGWLAVGGAVLVTLLSFKNTSYLVLLATLGYLFLILVSRQVTQYRRDSLKRLIVGYGAMLVIVVSVFVIAGLLIHFQDRMPTGSTDVRIPVYQAAWERFLSSPLYGSGFAGNTNVGFEKFAIMGQNRVVTHSDVLDALQHGGIIGFVLFVAAYATPFRLSRIGKGDVDARVFACMRGLRAVALGGVVVLFFNPIALNAPLSTIFWLNAAFMVGLARRCHEINCGTRIDNYGG